MRELDMKGVREAVGKMDWRTAESQHALDAHAESVREHLDACEGLVSLSELDAAWLTLRDALRAEDLLGFDSTFDAVRSLLLHADYRERWECSAALVQAFDAWKALRLAARLAGVGIAREVGQ